MRSRQNQSQLPACHTLNRRPDVTRFVSRFASELADEMSAQVEERMMRLYYENVGMPRL